MVRASGLVVWVAPKTKKNKKKQQKKNLEKKLIMVIQQN